ncbi:MAG: HPP family protein [Alphaproteobacteria bacterium]|nr:HPP family protein [Alphaproteobacteria bacterium]
MRHFLRRHQPSPCRRRALKAGLGALVGLAAVALLGEWAGVPLLIAPFGATCVLVFSVPESPLSQPANVIGGHLLAASVSVAADALLPEGPASLALTVGLVITLMAIARLTHPPAGADPLVILPGHFGVDFVLAPILVGSVALVLIATMVHRLPPRTAYPLRMPPNRI